MVDRGVAPDSISTLISENQSEKANDSYSKYEVARNAKTLFFAGKYTLERCPEIIEATTRILKELNIDYDFLPTQERPASALAYEMGLEKIVKKHVKKNETLFSNYSTIIFTDPDCQKAFKQLYAEWGKKIDAELLHISEFLVKHIKTGFLNNQQNAIVVFHDSTHLGRDLNIYDPPRQLITNIISKEPYEMWRNREQAKPCGSSLDTIYPDTSLKVSKEVIKEALTLGANILVVASPRCKISLERAIEKDTELEIIDLTEFVARNLKAGNK
jgi:Fe-S oxidoreductase